MIRATKRRLRILRGRWRGYLAVASRLSPYVGERRAAMVRAILLSLAFAATRLLEPWPLKWIIDAVLLDGHGSGAPRGLSRSALLYLLAGAIVALAMLRGWLYLRQRLLVSKLGIEISAALRQDLYKHIQALPMSFHVKRRTGDLIVRLTSDIRMLRAAFLTLPAELLEGVLLMTGMTAVMLWMDWQLALIALTMVPLIVLLVRRYQRPMRRAIRKQREREGHLASLASETLGAIQVVQGFRGEKREARRFGGANRKDVRSGMKASRFEAKLRWAADLSVSLVTAVILVFAARRILAASLSVGDLVVFVAYLRLFARPLRRISRITERMVRTAAAGERVLRVLDIESSVTDSPDAVRADGFRGDIRFDGVRFGYSERRNVLEQVNLAIGAGERVAIVGPTGTGKSTLVGLLPRFFDPVEGTVRIDGHDIRKFTLDSLRRQIALVFQEPVLFATTVAENISYGRPGASREAIERAARKARVDRVIEKLPDGYDTVVGERGGTLSGGQRQCIAIARAMTRNAPILVLDEPTTGLDERAARRVNRALRRLMRGRTVIMITHDPRNLEGVDRVVRLEDGRITDDRPAPRVPGPQPLEAS